MAKDTKASAAEAPAAAKSGGKGKLILILSLLIGAGASGGGVWFYMKNQNAKPAEVEVKKKPAPTFVPLDNFTVNLSDREHFLQVGVTYEVQSLQVADAIKQNMPILRGKILLLLASKEARELGSSEGKSKLMGELVAQAKEAVPEPAHQNGIETVHFSAFVIQ
ncbi:MAG: flagellar basal body-associated FliL family protein [Burkholderiales bacterium]